MGNAHQKLFVFIVLVVIPKNHQVYSNVLQLKIKNIQTKGKLKAIKDKSTRRYKDWRRVKDIVVIVFGFRSTRLKCMMI